MSSTNKSNNLNLNQWIGSDVPQREDFNNDNAIIDSVLGKHINNIATHTNASEKDMWNNPYFITTYYGDGMTTRALSLNCSFEPSWCIVFATNTTPSVTDISNESSYNYFGIATTRGSMSGLSISRKILNLTQSAVPVFSTEYRNYNQAGTTYVVIAVR